MCTRMCERARACACVVAGGTVISSLEMKLIISPSALVVGRCSAFEFWSSTTYTCVCVRVGVWVCGCACKRV